MLVEPYSKAAAPAAQKTLTLRHVGERPLSLALSLSLSLSLFHTHTHTHIGTYVFTHSHKHKHTPIQKKKHSHTHTHNTHTRAYVVGCARAPAAAELRHVMIYTRTKRLHDVS